MKQQKSLEKPLLFFLFSRLPAMLVICMGVLVIIGWQFDIEELKRIFFGLVAMNPLTAVCFIMGGVALYLQTTTLESFALRIINVLLPLLIVIFSVLKLLSIVYGFNAGIDSFMFSEKLLQAEINYPNRMAPNTALCFLLSGVALALNTKYYKTTQIFSLLAFLLAFLALIGYFYNAGNLYGFSLFIPMALNTAISFILLAVGILSINWDKGFMNTITSHTLGGLVARKLLPIIIVVPIVLGLLRIYGENKGFYPSEMGVALHVVLTIILFIIVVFIIARELISIEVKKREVEEKVRLLNSELEQKILDRTGELQTKLKELSEYKFALDEACIVAITDQKGVIKYVNNKFCEISEYSREELIGVDHRIINSGYHSKEFIRNLWVTIANGKVWRGEIKNKAKTGKYYWVYTTIVPILNEQGKPIEYLAIRADITEQKEAEEEIKTLNATLEQKVIERTAQLEEANKELETFSYSISHDLRAPLRAIQGFSKNLSEQYHSAFDETGQRWLNFITNNAQRMDDLILDILDLSRIGRKEIKLQKTDMNTLVQEVFDEQKIAYLNNSIEFTKDDLPTIYGDRTLLRLVWQNLIGNALKYSSKRDVIDIHISSSEDKNNYTYSIKDNGAGFDMRYYDKLFGVFQRLHTLNEYEGNGVGLATVKRILGKHKGTITGQGEIDKGATFTITLPKIPEIHDAE